MSLHQETLCTLYVCTKQIDPIATNCWSFFYQFDHQTLPGSLAFIDVSSQRKITKVFKLTRHRNQSSWWRHVSFFSLTCSDRRQTARRPEQLRTQATSSRAPAAAHEQGSSFFQLSENDDAHVVDTRKCPFGKYTVQITT